MNGDGNRSLIMIMMAPSSVCLDTPQVLLGSLLGSPSRSARVTLGGDGITRGAKGYGEEARRYAGEVK